MKDYECPATADNLRPVLSLVAEEMIACGTDTGLRQRLFVILEELYNNVARHAYADSPNPGPVRIRLAADMDTVCLEMADCGPPFNPLEFDDAHRLRNLEALEEGGEGIFLVRTLASDIDYAYENGWNRITVRLDS